MANQTYETQRSSVGRRKEDIECIEHGEAIDDLYDKYNTAATAIAHAEGSAATAKWLLGGFLVIFTMIVSFIGWVANDNLANIRMELKETKALVQSYQVKLATFEGELETLKRDLAECREHMKDGNRR